MRLVEFEIIRGSGGNDVSEGFWRFVIYFSSLFFLLSMELVNM